MSVMLRPPLRPMAAVGLAVRPMLRSPIATSSRIGARTFATLYESKVPPSTRPSTALKPGVRQSEEQRQLEVVGEEGKGSEGPHPKDQLQQGHHSLSDLSGAWTLMNPIYTETELDCVQVVGRQPVTLGDKAAHGSVKFLRRVFDFFTGYKNLPIPAEVLAENPPSLESVRKLRKQGVLLSDKAWLLRVILLESIAGVPGMVGGTLRHLRSLRLLRRDGGWIHTLLEEAENERMHLLTFMTISQPTIFTRALVLAAQGVFYNAFFLTYLCSPKTAHRFVGALEEEAVRTYTHCIHDIERGLVPEWVGQPAPQIAIDYWRLQPSASLLDVVRAVRADEATHRFVNHSLADLDHTHDFNPFALGEASAEIRGTKAGFTREESAAFARESQKKLEQEREMVRHGQIEAARA